MRRDIFCANIKSDEECNHEASRGSCIVTNPRKMEEIYIKVGKEGKYIKKDMYFGCKKTCGICG